MLLEFSVENFRSFRDRQTLCLEAGRDRQHPENSIRMDSSRVLKVAGLWGANASGKSNVIEALFHFRNLAFESAKWNRGDAIGAHQPFLLDREFESLPSKFSVVIDLKDRGRFEYVVSVRRDRVVSESLTEISKTGKRKRMIARRISEDDGSYDVDGTVCRDNAIVEKQTRDNATMLSTGVQLNVKELEPIYDWFQRLWVLDFALPPSTLLGRTARWIRDNPERKKDVARLLRHADLGIDDFEIQLIPLSVNELPEGLRDTLTQKQLQAIDAGSATGLNVVTYHRTFLSENLVKFSLVENDSKGTQRLFAMAGPVIDALASGAVLVVDEFDCSMHPLLAKRLVSLFQNRHVNTHGAQLVFATHDISLMDQKILRRDQVWLAEKVGKGYSELFSLEDVATRSTESFSKQYYAGVYGGVPEFGSVFEDDNPEWPSDGNEVGVGEAQGSES